MKKIKILIAVAWIAVFLPLNYAVSSDSWLSWIKTDACPTVLQSICTSPLAFTMAGACTATTSVFGKRVMGYEEVCSFGIGKLMDEDDDDGSHPCDRNPNAAAKKQCIEQFNALCEKHAKVGFEKQCLYSASAD